MVFFWKWNRKLKPTFVTLVCIGILLLLRNLAFDNSIYKSITLQQRKEYQLFSSFYRIRDTLRNPFQRSVLHLNDLVVSTIPNKTAVRPKNIVCQHPKLDLQSDSNRNAFFNVGSISCFGTEIFSMNKGRLKLDRSLLGNDRIKHCSYQSIERIDDNYATYTTPVGVEEAKNYPFEITVQHDFVRVQCYLDSPADTGRNLLSFPSRINDNINPNGKVYFKKMALNANRILRYRSIANTAKTSNTSSNSKEAKTGKNVPFPGRLVYKETNVNKKPKMLRYPSQKNSDVKMLQRQNAPQKNTDSKSLKKIYHPSKNTDTKMLQKNYFPQKNSDVKISQKNHRPKNTDTKSLQKYPSQPKNTDSKKLKSSPLQRRHDKLVASNKRGSKPVANQSEGPVNDRSGQSVANGQRGRKNNNKKVGNGQKKKTNLSATGADSSLKVAFKSSNSVYKKVAVVASKKSKSKSKSQSQPGRGSVSRGGKGKGKGGVGGVELSPNKNGSLLRNVSKVSQNGKKINQPNIHSSFRKSNSISSSSSNSSNNNNNQKSNNNNVHSLNNFGKNKRIPVKIPNIGKDSSSKNQKSNHSKSISQISKTQKSAKSLKSSKKNSKESRNRNSKISSKDPKRNYVPQSKKGSGNSTGSVRQRNKSSDTSSSNKKHSPLLQDDSPIPQLMLLPTISKLNSLVSSNEDHDNQGNQVVQVKENHNHNTKLPERDVVNVKFLNSSPGKSWRSQFRVNPKTVVRNSIGSSSSSSRLKRPNQIRKKTNAVDRRKNSVNNDSKAKTILPNNNNNNNNNNNDNDNSNNLLRHRYYHIPQTVKKKNKKQSKTNSSPRDQKNQQIPPNLAAAAAAASSDNNNRNSNNNNNNNNHNNNKLPFRSNTIYNKGDKNSKETYLNLPPEQYGIYNQFPDTEQFFVQVQPKPEVFQRISEIPQFVHLNTIPLNILVYGLDSLSHLAFQRKLPLSYSHLKHSLGAVIMNGYNIVGDATAAAIIPLLTGRTETELPEVRKNQLNSGFVDEYPLVWNKFRSKGYVTLFAEDCPGLGVFNLRFNGFYNAPTDHYMRPFWQAISESVLDERSTSFCLGSKPKHQFTLEYVKDFFEKYDNVSKFAFSFHGELSHNDNNPIQFLDEDLLSFLKAMRKGNHLNNTLLIVMSDHGARYSNVRNTVQGKLEERLPFMSFVFPEWFHSKYPYFMKNLRGNQERLVTPFDVHEMFLDLLDSTRMFEPVDYSTRGLSLLQPIPLNRTCKSAGIAMHWCSCLSRYPVNPSSQLVHKSIQKVMSYIRALLQPLKSMCSQLALKRIFSVYLVSPNEKVLKFISSKDPDNRVANFSRQSLLDTIHYQLTFQTKPNDALYEASVKVDLQNQNFQVFPEISRLNRYGDQPNCIQDKFPDLRKYCYCRNS